MKVHLASLGCKLNQSEMESLQAQLEAAGWELSPAHEADVIVLNTCAVTAEAARKSRQALRRLRAEAPGAHLVATGCYAELWPQEVEAAARPDSVVGNRDKARLADLLHAQFPGVAATVRKRRAAPAWPRTRAFVKIQDGCDNACAYCVVHIARGPSRSLPADGVVAQVREAAEAGRKEVVLTGVNIGAYGLDTGGPDLGDLIGRILAETAVPRIRLSSVEPWSFREEWLALWADPRLCPHFHLPLQSGSDAVLRRMNRPCSAGDFLRLVETIRHSLPDAAITTDIIVGFPGETEADHRATLALAERAGFARAHVFPFSPRPGTPAASMSDAVPRDEVLRRAAELRALGARLAAVYAQRFVGRTMDVLWEQSPRGGIWTGLTVNYLRVRAQGDGLGNRILPARLVGMERGGIVGVVVSSFR
ncbi:MAG: tRNA (N(6)-L-threonylcarbamoyladenosine(37)-C(2))-methylthiotransferase MtaB [Anaerolineae bacterium]|jgi:threonylcarbamoyladenosine tRNA methylthiotransferase MtaB|nr:tRNA (N(6)-L-threonylcarbamoyladenosine(37)-C(2))-methylthiotransferase MtaB [Anaerolineae bacterium]